MSSTSRLIPRTTAGSVDPWLRRSISPTANQPRGRSGTATWRRQDCRPTKDCRGIYGAGRSRCPRLPTSVMMTALHASVCRLQNPRGFSGPIFSPWASCCITMDGQLSSAPPPHARTGEPSVSFALPDTCPERARSRLPRLLPRRPWSPRACEPRHASMSPAFHTSYRELYDPDAVIRPRPAGRSRRCHQTDHFTDLDITTSPSIDRPHTRLYDRLTRVWNYGCTIARREHQACTKGGTLVAEPYQSRSP